VRFRVPRRALLALLAVLTLAAALPAAGSASIAPKLALSPGSVSAGAAQSLGFDIAFSPSPGDYPTSFSLTLPSGLVPNLDLAGGACLNSATPTAGCELGSGTATTTLSTTTPVSLWLVKAPGAADAAGAALVAGDLPGGPSDGAGAITLQTTPDVGFVLSVAGLPAIGGFSALDLTLTGVRAPTTCSPVTVGVSATSESDPTPATNAAALSVTGCSSLVYSPTLAATVDKDATDSGAVFTATVSEPATASATKGFEVDVPASVTPNVSAALGCLLGTPCTIGTASAVSPFLPASALSNGTVVLGGSITAPTLTVTFPAPYPIMLTGTVNISTEALTFGDIPDLPLTTLSLVVGGGSSTQLFGTTCAASSLTVKLTPWDGAAQQTVSAPVTFGGSCPATPTGPSPPTSTNPAKPTVSGASLRGLVARSARFAFTVKEGTDAKPIKRIALGLPKGLTFPRSKASLVKGIVVRAGAHAKKAKFTAGVSHGVLTITLSSPTTKAEITVQRPALAVSSKLARSVKTQLRRKKVDALRFAFRLTDSAKTATRLTLRLKPRS